MAMEIVIERQVFRQVHRINPVEYPEQRSVSSASSASSQLVASSNTLRPCQKAYYGNSYRTVDNVARRLFKRSAHCLRDPDEEAIFAEHAANLKHVDVCGRPSQGSFGGPAARAATPRGFNVAIISGIDLEKKEHKLNEQRKVLIMSINAARYLQGLPLVTLDEDLTDRLQSYADMLPDLEHFSQYGKLGPDLAPITSISRDELFALAEDGARLVSPPHMGALAVGEMWASGKFKGHRATTERERQQAIANRAMCPERTLKRLNAFHIHPVFKQPYWLDPDDTGSEDSPLGSTTQCTGSPRTATPLPSDDGKKKYHSTSCACHLEKVYETMLDPKWKIAGIGCTEDGRWVVEFADTIVERKAFEAERG